MSNKYLDFHSHILPGLDHGSDSLEVSLKQLEMAKEAGIGVIVATSHFYPDKQSVGNFLERREKAFSEISEHLSDGTSIICAAEVLLCEGLHNLPELDELKIGASNTILIEMPDPPWTNRHFETLIKIRNKRGLEIVIAHVDRYLAQDVEELFSLGVQGQLNVSAFHRIFKCRRYFRWIDDGKVTALGSDIHGIHRAYTDYKQAMRLLGSRGEILQRSMRKILMSEKSKVVVRE